MSPYVGGLLAYPMAQAGGLIVAVLLTAHLAARDGLPVRRVLSALAILVPAALAGAIWSARSLQINRGLGYPGAGVAVLAALPLAWRVLGGGISLLGFGDLLAAPMAFALAMGKMGCFLHGCCHGPQSRVPWAVAFPRRSVAWFNHLQAGLIDPAAARSLPVHPLQLYFAAWAGCVGLLLLAVRRRKAYGGQLILLFLATHEAGRFVHEGFKVPPDVPLQRIALIVSLLAAAALVVRMKRAGAAA